MDTNGIPLHGEVWRMGVGVGCGGDEGGQGERRDLGGVGRMGVFCPITGAA